jgi:hypothetical protein
MEQLRILLLLVLAAGAMTGAATAAAWWFTPQRRLHRILTSLLKRRPDAEAIDPAQGRAAGLDLESGAIAVLWDKGGSGLVYALNELEGAELIVDGHVAARVGRAGDRRALDALPRDAEQVTLRLIFADARWPEFELELWGPDSVARSGDVSAHDAIRLGRRWLAHVDAVLKAKPETQVSPAPGAALH